MKNEFNWVKKKKKNWFSVLQYVAPQILRKKIQTTTLLLYNLGKYFCGSSTLFQDL